MRQITRAMKLISASRLKRAQDRVTAARPYSVKIAEVLSSLASRTGDYTNPLLEQRGDDYLILLLVTADKGLCGAFNTNLLKGAMEFQRTHPGKRIDFIAVGRKGRDFARRRGHTILSEYIGFISKTVTYDQSTELAQEVIKLFTEEEEGKALPDKVYIMYNEFKSALSQKVVLKQILPIGTITQEAVEVPNTGKDYIYEQPPEKIFGSLLPHYVETQIFQALLESVASEHGARMTAMESASKNASEVIDRLTLGMNRIRQASITREIIEVVSGAAAL
jgi:F-type H+-transporting ATPase subunit gamma